MTGERLLCFLPDLDGGGAQRTMVNLVNAFPSVGIDPILVAARGSGPALRWVADRDVVRDLEAGRIRHAFRPLRRIIRWFRPDLVFSTMVDANIVAGVAASTLRGAPPIVLRETNSHRARGDLGPLRRRMAAWAYRRADAVVALSEGVRQELVEDYGLASSTTFTLPNPVDIGAIEQAAEAARTDPSSAGRRAKQDGPLLVAIGRLTRQKGFDSLIDAFAALRTEGVRLVILGEGPDRGALEERGRQLGAGDRLIMPGFVETPAAWLAHADAFVLSSRWEGFGHVIVEAMACGVPVIATDCPHGPADILQHGRNGLLVPLGEGLEERLRERIDDLLASPGCRHAFQQAGYSTALTYQSEAIAGRYADLFRRVLRSGNPGEAGRRA